ncbi:glycosyltransferase family 31 protein [Cadophora sp. DSE1049]|nr:glycosyltransferase family 31 protein [Cadophora sp. DSE1049]
MLPRANLRLRLSIAALISCLVLYFLLPYDNPLVLLIRWHTGNVKYYTKGAFGTFPVDVSDIGMIIKTGYATRDRLRVKLETLGKGWDVENVVIVGDYAGEETLGEMSVEVVDVLEGLLQVEGISGDEKRMGMYKEFRKAIEETPDSMPEAVVKMGWELDILKHIPALELGLQKLPSKSWCLLTDDDSYTHTPSLLSILSTLSPLKSHYIGNAIGAYTCRFAHGGSGIVFSSTALRTIFPSPNTTSKSQTKTPKLLTQAKINSLTSPFGDLLIAELAMQNGIYVKEDYGLHFNGESPRRTKISEQRGCVTLVGFHKMGVEEMKQTGEIFGNGRGMSRVLRWWDTWGTFGKDLMRLKLKPGSHVDVREAWDYVGSISDQHPRIEMAEEMACMELCSKEKGCLAWTWEKWGKKCVVSDKFTVGYERGDAFSGLDIERIGRLAKKCGDGG